MYDTASSELDLLSPAWLAAEMAFVLTIAVGRVIADCASWSAVIRADTREPWPCCSADFDHPAIGT
jgi:hypothetical protein